MMYFKDRTIELRERCKPFLDEHGLKMRMNFVDGDYAIDFVGDKFHSPVRVVFKGPGEEKHSEASWLRGYLDIDCYDCIDIDDSWKTYSPKGSVQYEFEGPEERALEETAHWLERCDLIPHVKDLPGLCNSKQLAWACVAIDHSSLAVDFSFSRDESGEMLGFESNGHKFEVLYPAQQNGAEQAHLRVDGGPPQAFEASDTEGLVAAVREEAWRPADAREAAHYR